MNCWIGLVWKPAVSTIHSDVGDSNTNATGRMFWIV
jgi:hypothetical protein